MSADAFMTQLRDILAWRQYEWGSPQYLWLGWLLLALALWGPLRYLLARRWALPLALRGQGKRRPPLPGRPVGGLGRRFFWLPGLLVLAGLALLWLALLRPQKVTSSSEHSAQVIDVMLALDISGSMMSADVLPSRVQGAKNALKGFVDGLEGDRVGLVVFAAKAFTQCPLSLDHGVVKYFIDQVTLGETVRVDGTAIGDALLTAVERLTREPGRNSVIVLATDGDNNAGIDPRKAAEVAAAAGVKVYTIGIGQRGGYDTVVRGPFGMAQRVHFEEPDEGLLTYIASSTGGRYWRATDAGSLSAVYQEISRLEKREVKVRARRDAEEHFYPFLLAGALLLGLGLLARLRVRNTL